MHVGDSRSTHVCSCRVVRTPAASTWSHPSIVRPRISNGSTSAHREPVGLGGVGPDEQAALAARGHRHLPVDEERESTEHPLLGDAALAADQLTDAVGEVFVVRHRPSVRRSGVGVTAGVRGDRAGGRGPGGLRGARRDVGVAPPSLLQRHEAEPRRPSASTRRPAAASTGAPVVRWRRQPEQPEVPTDADRARARTRAQCRRRRGAMCSSSKRVRSAPRRSAAPRSS